MGDNGGNEMLVLTAAMLMAWSVLALAPDTPIARGLRRILVAAPAARLSRVGTGSLFLAILLALLAAGAAWLMQEEAIRLAAMAAPEVALWIGTFEVATWLDAAVAVAATAGVLRPGAMLERFRAARPRAARTRPARRPAPRGANDADGPAHALAA